MKLDGLRIETTLMPCSVSIRPRPARTYLLARFRVETQGRSMLGGHHDETSTTACPLCIGAGQAKSVESAERRVEK